MAELTGSSRPAMRLTDAQRLDWLRLIRSENVGPRTFRSALNHFGGASAALEGLPELARKKGRQRIQIYPRDAALREMEAAERAGVRFIATGEPEYPVSLQAIDAAPPLLAVQGRVDLLSRPAAGIVGSRNASAAGIAMAQRLAAGLGQGGFAVVSGLARGIDAAAHRASLDTGTVAVLAGGHLRIYPREHQGLVERIVENGAVVSEMPLDWEPRGRDFPRRNRVVSGLSLGVIVVEAARRSGSLITARFALEQGRELFAVPGSPVDPRAEGPNDLLREGATLATCVEDIISVLSPLKSRDTAGAGEIEQGTFDGPPLWDELDLFAEAVRTRSPAASWDDFAGSDADYAPVEHEEESSSEIVLALVGTMPISLDEIIRASGLAVPEVRSSLVELELAGAIQRVDVDRFARVVTVDEFNAAAD